jgi:hypothetical protein
MSQSIEKAINKIENLQSELNSDLQENELLQIRCNYTLETLANGMKHLIGLPIGDAVSVEFIPTPLRNVLGENVEHGEVIKEDTVKPSEADKEALKKQAIECYETILDRDSKAVLDAVEDIVIRATAKKAGLQVSSIDPAKITVDFIDKIKQAILDKQAVAEVVASTGVLYYVY